MKLTDAEVGERLKDWARSAFPQSKNNGHAMNDWVKRILDFMREVEPAEYGEVHAAVFNQPHPSWPGEDVLTPLSVLYRKLDDEGMHVQANTVGLAMDEIKGLRGRATLIEAQP